MLRTQVGVVFNPILNELYHATRGGGAFLNGAPITASDTTELRRAVVSRRGRWLVRVRAQPCGGAPRSPLCFSDFIHMASAGAVCAADATSQHVNASGIM